MQNVFSDKSRAFPYTPFFKLQRKKEEKEPKAPHSLTGRKTKVHNLTSSLSHLCGTHTFGQHPGGDPLPPDIH
jgi:hypothetical protein